MHEAEQGNTVQKQRIKTALLGIKPEAVCFYRPKDTVGIDKLCAVLDWTIPITELFRCGTEQNARKTIKQLHCDKSSIDIIPNKLKSVTSCSVLMRENSIHILK